MELCTSGKGTFIGDYWRVTFSFRNYIIAAQYSPRSAFSVGKSHDVQPGYVFLTWSISPPPIPRLLARPPPPPPPDPHLPACGCAWLELDYSTHALGWWGLLWEAILFCLLHGIQTECGGLSMSPQNLANCTKQQDHDFHPCWLRSKTLSQMHT